jgi:Zn-dependent M28 family amino/carboxypeptidase
MAARDELAARDDHPDLRRRWAAALVLIAGLSSAPHAFATTGISEGGPFRHLQALQSIAEANGGNRAAGTPGYDRSADYVADELKAAGYAVRFEEFSFPYSEERAPPVLARAGEGGSAFPREAMRTLSNSGSGDVTARLQPVDLKLDDPLPPSTSGCEPEDFAGFERGHVALVRRGTCPFQLKVDHAVAAGAAAVLIMNQGTGDDTGVFGGRLATRAGIPVLGVTTELGRSLAGAAQAPEGITVRLAITIESGTRTTRNVIAERPGTGPLVVAGAHLDSVSEGPGINDNGSGSAVLLEAALRLAREPATGQPVRFAFWGAEERGLIGSRHHVNGLSDEERSRIAVYINLDMVGSANFGRFIQSNGEGQGTDVRRRFVSFFAERGLPIVERTGRRPGFGTDDASFAEKNIPTVGLFTGAGETKDAEQAIRFGGLPARPYDPCYHKACDALSNIDRGVLEEMTDALVHVLRVLAVAPERAEP